MPVNQLAFHDEELKLVLEAGKIKVMVGASSTDIRFEGSFEIIGAPKTLFRARLFVCPVEVS